MVYLWFIEYITWRGGERGEGNTKCPFAKNVFFCENSVTCKLYMNARNALNLEEDLTLIIGRQECVPGLIDCQDDADDDDDDNDDDRDAVWLCR